MSNNMKKPGHKGGILLRLIKTLFGFYPVLCRWLWYVFCLTPLSVPSLLFLCKTSLPPWRNPGRAGIGLPFPRESWAWWQVGIFYALSLIAGFVYNQLMAIITQGSLAKMREKNVQRHAETADPLF